MPKSKSVLISFLGNINYDSRCNNLFTSLKQSGYKIKFFGFDWQVENFQTQSGEKNIIKLNKGKFSVFFYLKFALLLFTHLLKNKYDIYFAEDIYTLPLIIMGSKKNAQVFYDSRELYGHLAGLRKRKIIQSFLTMLEKIFIEKVDYVITTGNMDANFLRKKYNIGRTVLLRNLPNFIKPNEPINFRKKFNIPVTKKILLYQGVILHGRGLRLIFDVLKNTSEFVCIIIGGGEQKEYYENLSVQLGIKDKVIFYGKVPQDELVNLTAGADVGLSLIENVSLSYYYALPNKLFEYIMAGVPVLVSNLPQMEEIIKKYKVGEVVNPYEKNQIEEALNKLTGDKDYYQFLKNNCKQASEELNWEKEIINLYRVLE